MQRDTKQRMSRLSNYCFCLRILILSAVFIVFSESLLAQDPCAVKNEYDNAKTELENANHKITKPAKPTGDGGSPLSKPTAEQLKQAEEAKDKAEKAKDSDQSALRQANEAVTKFNNDPQKGKKLSDLQSRINTLEGNIKKAQDANAKISLQDRMELNNFRMFEIKPLQDAIKSQMPGLSLEEAQEKVEDASYEGFSNGDIDAIRKEIERNQEVIKKMNDKYSVGSSAVPTAGDDEQIEKAQAAIRVKTAELKTAIENCRKSVQGNFSTLGRKESEYGEKQKKLYPDEETRNLINSLAEMQSELRTIKAEEKTLGEEQRKLQNEVKQAKEKFEGGTKDGKPFNGSEKAYKDADQKVKSIEAALKKFEDYDKKEKEWTDAEEKKSKAEQKVKDKTPGYNTAVGEKNTALTNAQTAAALSGLDARLKIVNQALVKEAAKEILDNNAKVAENKKKIEQLLKTAQNEDQKKLLRQRWKDYFTKLVRPHYIRKRNKAEADRLGAIKDDAALQKFNCFKDVADFIQDLNIAINDVLSRTASLVSDMDTGIDTGADEPIPVPVPPLDESGADETPTDEVPDDIIANTGAVKGIQYFVFLLTNSSNGLYVGSEDSLKGQTRCSFVGGGINCAPSDVVTYKKLLGPFASQAEAQQALCQSITETRYFPLGVGLKGRWQGGNTWYGLWNASVSGCSAR